MILKKIPRRYIIPLLCCFIYFYSCNTNSNKSSVSTIFDTDYVDENKFKLLIKNVLIELNESDTLFEDKLVKDTNGMLNTAYAYQLNNFQPIWMDASGMKPYASSLINELQMLQEEGMDTARYHITALQSLLEQAKSKKEMPLDSLVFIDKTFTTTWLLAAKDMLLGVNNIKKADSLWFAKNDTIFNGASLLVSSLQATETLPSFDTFRPDAKIYGKMKQLLGRWQNLKNDTAYIAEKENVAINHNVGKLRSILHKELPEAISDENDTSDSFKALILNYQYYHHLKRNGLLDSATISSLGKMPDTYISLIRMNMDRIRALPKNTEGEHIWVSIPSMEVNYYKDNQVLFRDKVVVGKISRQTPTLWANMTNIVFNPPWGVPPTILKNDIGPGVSRSGSAYLAKKGLRAFDSKGNDVTGSVNGANYRRYTYRQPPGAGNSLGEVKFNLPNSWDIYLHDTPHRENFSNSYRALSSGCVRVNNPKILAEVILNDEKYTADKIDTIISTRKTKTEKLGRRLPVYIIYTTIAEDSTGTQLRYLTDVYGRDKKMLSLYR